MGYCFSLLLLSKPATETLLDVSEIFLIVSGFVLVFGAIGEYLEEHEKLPRWMKWPKLVFIIMVVASLIGEFFSDAGVFLFSRHLQTISEREFAALNVEAGEARKEAKEAGLETARLYAAVAPRRLTLDHQQKLGMACRAFAGQVVTLSSYGADPEARALIEQIVAGLRTAQITGVPAGAVYTAGRLLTGVRVSGSNQGLVDAIESSLRNDGHVKMAAPDESIVPAGAASNQIGEMTPADLAPSGAHIFVGLRPIELIPPPRN